MAGGAFLAYIESRTFGLPGLPSWEPFTEPPGPLSLVVEATFLGLAITGARPEVEEGYRFSRRTHVTQATPRCPEV